MGGVPWQDIPGGRHHNKDENAGRKVPTTVHTCQIQPVHCGPNLSAVPEGTRNYNTLPDGMCSTGANTKAQGLWHTGPIGRAGLKTPRTAHEWCFTILNGGRFLQTTVVQLESRLTELETACSRFCHTMHIERDTRINSMLIDKY